MNAIVTGIETGHGDRPVELVEHEGTVVVRKRYTSTSAETVFGEMQDLWRSDFGHLRPAPLMAAPLHLDVHANSLTMAHVPGAALGTRGGLGRTEERLDEVVNLLAALHDSQVVADRRRDADRLVRALGRKAAELVGTELHEAFAEAVARVAAVAPRAEVLVVNHGDFSPRNLLEAPWGLVLIDFDRLQMAGRGRDLAYLGAWCWATGVLADGIGDWGPAERARGRYLERVPAAAAELEQSWAFHLAASLLRIAHGWSALAARPDLARDVIGEAVRISHTRGVA